MEEKLKALFDFQAFVKNPALEKIIADAQSRSAKRMLSLDDAALVAAAGEQPALRKEPREGGALN